MALVISGEVGLNCAANAFAFYEYTGAYSVSNTKGFGTPNIAVGDIDSSTIIISNETTNVIYDTITFTHSATYGNLTNFTLSLIKLAGVAITEIVDGIWRFYITVVDGSTRYYLELKLLVMNDIKCGLLNLIKKYSEQDCNCTGIIRENMLTAYAKYIALTTSVICSNETNIETQLDSLNNYLDSLNCEC